MLVLVTWMGRKVEESGTQSFTSLGQTRGNESRLIRNSVVTWLTQPRLCQNSRKFIKNRYVLFGLSFEFFTIKKYPPNVQHSSNFNLIGVGPTFKNT